MEPRFTTLPGLTVVDHFDQLSGAADLALAERRQPDRRGRSDQRGLRYTDALL
jgi:hypothetical protein